MDVDAIRSRFIQDNLRRALQERDRERAVRTMRAFRNYFQWFENRLPDLEKLTIVNQLARLEESYADGRPEEAPREPSHVSAH
jgi:hypothetical protein